MLTFSSEIHVKPECGRVEAMMLLNSWFKQSDLSGKWLSEKKASPFEQLSDNKEFSESAAGIVVDITNEKDFLLVQIQTEDEAFQRNTFCIFREAEEQYKQTFYVGEMLDAKKFGTAFTADSAGIYAREIVQHIFWNDYQEGFDGGILNSDRTIFLTGANLQTYADVLSGKGEAYANPLLYIPYSASDLACRFERSFVGQLHILAEGSPLTCDKLKGLIGKSADKGLQPDRIFLKWHDGTKREIASTQDAIDDIDHVVDKLQVDLQDVLSERGRNERFSLSGVREAKLLSRLGTDPELQGVFDSIINDKDSEIKKLKSEVATLKKQCHEEKSKADALQNGYTKTESSDQTGMFVMDETPKYDHEFEDIILRVLEKERDGMNSDPTLKNSRKYHVLCDILAHNFPSETGTELKSLIREVFTAGRLTRDGIGRLQSAGFTVEKNDRAAHYRISWDGDDRYVSTYATSTSDHRSGKNAASDYVNMCFGY